jgi:hypothetical protein
MLLVLCEQLCILAINPLCKQLMFVQFCEAIIHGWQLAPVYPHHRLWLQQAIAGK